MASVTKQITDKAQYYLAQFDKELSKLPWAVELEKRTNVPKTYIFGGAGFVLFVLIFFNVWADLLTDLVGFIYPAYSSFKAIESTSKDDDTQWLTYWTVFGFLNLIEFFSDLILYWVPFYHLFKTLFLIYLFLPHFKGAQTLYVKFIRPTLLQNQSAIDTGISKFKKNVTESVSEAASSLHSE